MMKVEGLKKGQNLSYDPITQTHIVGGQGIRFQSPEGKQQCFLSQVSELEEKKEAPKIPSRDNPKSNVMLESLRWVQNKQSNNLIISPSGMSDEMMMNRVDGNIKAKQQIRRAKNNIH